MLTLPELLERTMTLHNHLCPRQVLGIRMGMLAGELLGLELPQTNKRVLTLVETDGCFADGVSVATGCTLGHRTLRLIDYGKVAAVIVDTESEQAVRIWPHAQSRSRAVEQEADAKSRWHAQLEAYQTMSSDALLCWEPVALTLSLRALLSRPGARAACAVCGEEIINEREVLVDGQTLCQSCAGEAYYTVLEKAAWR